MKSALEIAMEKTSAIGEQARQELEKLSPEQRDKIEEIKKVYEGKIAEKDVLHQQELMKMTGGAPIEAIESATRTRSQRSIGRIPSEIQKRARGARRRARRENRSHQE